MRLLWPAASSSWSSSSTATASSACAAHTGVIIPTNTRPGGNLGAALHALPSRQMPSIVHHAGLELFEVRWLITCVMPPRFKTATGDG